MADSTSPPVENERVVEAETALKRVTGIRDGILALAGMLYFLGYIVWSYNSWINNLGLLPAVQSQYFAAGAFPGIVLGVVILIGNIAGKALQNPAWPNSVVLLKRIPARHLVFVLLALSGILFLGLLFLRIRNRLPLLLEVLTPILFLCANLGLFSLFSLFAPHKRMHIYIIRAYTKYFLPVGLGALGLIFFVFVVYPNLPQEFGGTKPRCAYLDIDDTKISQAILIKLRSRETQDNKSDMPGLINLTMSHLGR